MKSHKQFIAIVLVVFIFGCKDQPSSSPKSPKINITEDIQGKELYKPKPPKSIAPSTSKTRSSDFAKLPNSIKNKLQEIYEVIKKDDLNELKSIDVTVLFEDSKDPNQEKQKAMVLAQYFGAILVQIAKSDIKQKEIINFFDVLFMKLIEKNKKLSTTICNIKLTSQKKYLHELKKELEMGMLKIKNILSGSVFKATTGGSAKQKLGGIVDSCKLKKIKDEDFSWFKNKWRIFKKTLYDLWRYISNKNNKNLFNKVFSHYESALVSLTQDQRNICQKELKKAKDSIKKLKNNDNILKVILILRTIEELFSNIQTLLNGIDVKSNIDMYVLTTQQQFIPKDIYKKTINDEISNINKQINILKENKENDIQFKRIKNSMEGRYNLNDLPANWINIKLKELQINLDLKNGILAVLDLYDSSP